MAYFDFEKVGTKELKRIYNPDYVNILLNSGLKVTYGKPDLYQAAEYMETARPTITQIEFPGGTKFNLHHWMFAGSSND